MAISNKVGPPVTGDDFYGRVKELSQAYDYLDTNHSLVLSAPRRIGKSSFAKRLVEDKKKVGWNCVYIDLEGVQSQEEFLNILINKFEKSKIWSQAMDTAGGFLNRVIEGVKGIGPIKIDFSHPEISQNLYSLLSESINHTKNTLVVIDELPLFLNSIDKEDQSHKNVGFMLNWLRSLRQVTDTKIRWIFCGSVGLHNFTSMRNLTMTINDMVSFDFDALSKEEAEGLTMALAESLSLPISERVVKYILDKIEWYIPYFIQLIFSTIKNYPDVRNGITEKMIDDAFDQISHNDELSTWYERLAEYNGYREGAVLLLNALSMADNGLSRAELLDMYAAYTEESLIQANAKFSLILNMIEHDGYIIRLNGGIRRFHSPLIKNWWFSKFVE
ncbi:MAG: AAA family ATPase [Muribaculaceae bacterium]|nr:AAA family ATPase [Muribaculaceae bacterium]